MDNLSPTAIAVDRATMAWAIAREIAVEAEGTDRESDLRAMYRATYEAYLAACAAHRAACDAWMNTHR